MRGGHSGPNSPVRASVSIMEPLKRKRALSVPPVERQLAHVAPNPWRALGPLGEAVTRTATSLAELAVQTAHTPDTWVMQEEIASSVTHDFLVAKDNAWNSGIKHGEWLAAQQLLQERARQSALQAQLVDLQMRFDVLEGEFIQAKAALDRCALRDLSNQHQ